MDSDQLRAIFDQQAGSYDARWARTAPIRDALHLLVEAAFTDLPEQARLLCVGAGTGAEVVWLAQRFARWQFVVVEPSAAMVAVCRAKAEAAGCLLRCAFHEDYLATLPAADFDGATAFLVSQFITDRAARTAFFREIAQRLKPGGLLASADLAADVTASDYDVLLAMWARLTAAQELSADALSATLTRLRETWQRDVAILPPAEVAGLISAGGFEAPLAFYRAGLIHAWRSRRQG